MAVNDYVTGETFSSDGGPTMRIAHLVRPWRRRPGLPG
jgi:hypothetical protein